MKKKSTNSQSAFLNLRVLFGLFVMLAGVFLALVSFGPARTGFAQGTTRQEMTLALAQALDVFQPPACVPGSEMFNDVPASSPFCPFIEELSRRGVTGGCAPDLFCPGDPVARQQMAVFLVKAIFPEPFHIVGATGEPPFENGWTNSVNVPARTPVGFYMDSTGVVHLKGSLIAGATGTVAFTLPAGYSPSAALLVPAADGGGNNVKELRIENTGAVRVFCETAGGCTGSSTGIDAVSFRVGTGGASPINGSPSGASKGLTPDS